MPQQYYQPFASAYVRGKALTGMRLALADDLLRRALAELADAEHEQIAAAAVRAGLRIHRFKRATPLRRVQQALGILRSLAPQSLLDVGSGRGAFLWPLLDDFPDLPVVATDTLRHRFEDLAAVARGGVTRLFAVQMDATVMPFVDEAFEAVTFLEVLEHIPDAQRALSEAIRVASRSVIVSVPSREDDNPEHIHLFNESALRDMFGRAGASHVNVTYVLNHLIAVARVD